MRRIRVLVYHGPEDWLEICQGQSLSDGLHTFGGSARSIRAYTLPGGGSLTRLWALFKILIGREN